MRGRRAAVLLLAAAVVLLPSCSRRPQPSREDEVWIQVDLDPLGRAEVEIWVKGGGSEVRKVSEALAPSLFPGGLIESVRTVEDDGSELHGVVAVQAAFQPGPEVVAGFDMSEAAAYLGEHGYDHGSLSFCWPGAGSAVLTAEPAPSRVGDTSCAHWNRFPAAVDATVVIEPEPETWLLRVPLILLTGAVPVAAMRALKRSRVRPDGAKRALRWSLASVACLAIVFDFPPSGDPGTALALSGIADRALATVVTVAWMVTFALWVGLLYFIGPFLLLLALYERRRARRLSREAGNADPSTSGR